MTSVQLDVWNLITLLIMFVSAVALSGRLMLDQLDKRLSARFRSMEAVHSQSMAHWDAKFATLFDDQRAIAEATRSLERDLLKLRGDLPLEYVRREDFIRNQSVIEAKLDALALHMQNAQLMRNAQLKGTKHD